MISESGAGFPNLGENGRSDSDTSDVRAKTSDWLEAQARLATALAEAALVVGAYRERMRAAPRGMMRRLLFWQAATLTALGGERLLAEQLALMQVGQLFGSNARQPAVRHASVIIDILDGPIPVSISMTADGAFLHPLIRSAFLLFSGKDVRDERDRAIAMARAVRLLASDQADAPGFVPVLPGSWPVEKTEMQLEWWLAALRGGCAEALTLLSQLEAWHRHAEAVSTGWSGRTHARLIRVIGAWPVVSAAMAESESAASRAAVQRNLDRLARAGLVREVTGQNRYRLWAADLEAASPTPAPSIQA